MSDEKVIHVVLQNRNDYFKILGNARGQELHRHYKKLCLQLHPDKNKHPRAEEAFKVLREAYEVLSDDAQRATYERHGAEGVKREESTGSPHAGPRRRHYEYHGYGADPAFEDFFEFFGGPSMRRRRAQQQHAQQHQRHPGGQHPQFEVNGNILMLVPFLLFFLMAMLLQSVDLSGDAGSAFTRSRGASKASTNPTQLFTLAEEGPYVVERTTRLEDYPHLNVQYYVQRNFHQMLQWRRMSVRTVEIEVLRNYRDSLKRRCNAERMEGRAKHLQRSCHQLGDFKGLP